MTFKILFLIVNIDYLEITIEFHFHAVVQLHIVSASTVTVNLDDDGSREGLLYAGLDLFRDKGGGYSRHLTVEFSPVSSFVKLCLLTTLEPHCVVVPVYGDNEGHLVGEIRTNIFFIIVIFLIVNTFVS